MKKLLRITGFTLALFALAFTITAFVMQNPKADYKLNQLAGFDGISLEKVSSDHTQHGMFKSTVTFQGPAKRINAREFYGQEILIRDNDQVDRILIGVTNNLISRIEIWNKGKLIETEELGFVSKMTWGARQKMVVQFYDQTNSRYRGKSKIRMRFYSGTGFLGDIGTINYDLTKYGDLSGEKEIALFAKSLEGSLQSYPGFTNLRIWKNFNSFD